MFTGKKIHREYKDKDMSEGGNDWWNEVLSQGRDHRWQEILTLKRRNRTSLIRRVRR